MVEPSLNGQKTLALTESEVIAAAGHVWGLHPRSPDSGGCSHALPLLGFENLTLFKIFPVYMSGAQSKQTKQQYSLTIIVTASP